MTQIIEGAEPLFKLGSGENGRIGIQVIHGFTGNPQSMRKMADAFLNAGYSVSMPLLPGHGTVIEDMLDKTYSDFYEAAKLDFEKFATQVEEVFVFGLSMGGLIALNLAVDKFNIAGLMLVNPIVLPPNDELVNAIKSLLEAGTEIAPGIGSDIKKDGAKEYSYSGTPLRSVLSLFDGAKSVAERIGNSSAPLLLFSSREDHVVDPENGEFIQEHYKGQLERVFLENSYHVATLDNDAGLIEKKSLGFVETNRTS